MTMRVLLFTRYPRPGEAKTRLGARIGMDRAAALQTAFIRDELCMLESMQAATTLCCDPAAPLDDYRRLFGAHLSCREQRGADLGERMLHALHTALAEGARRVVLIGSDLPDLPARQVETAFAALEDAPLCIGPAPDGGFHLLGLSAPLPPGIFAGVEWGGAGVLGRVLDTCRTLGLAPALLEPWPDVDTAEDLAAYARRNRDRDTHTMALVRAFNLAPEAWKS